VQTLPEAINGRLRSNRRGKLEIDVGSPIRVLRPLQLIQRRSVSSCRSPLSTSTRPFLQPSRLQEAHDHVHISVVRNCLSGQDRDRAGETYHSSVIAWPRASCRTGPERTGAVDVFVDPRYACYFSSVLRGLSFPTARSRVPESLASLRIGTNRYRSSQAVTGMAPSDGDECRCVP